MRRRIELWRGRLEKPLMGLGLWPLGGHRLPDFLGIGAQKSGTTWLHERLARNPAIYFPEKKEQHYFDENFHRPLARYSARFAPAGGRTCGEVTPAYAVLDEARVGFIAAVVPRVRAIFLMRDPVERAWSSMTMVRLEHERRDPGSVTVGEWIEFARSPWVLDRSRYLVTVDRWARHLGRERLCLGFLEEIRERPAELLERVESFLGVPPIDRERLDPGFRDPVLQQPGRPMPDAVRDELVRALADQLRGLADRFGGPALAWKARWLG
jgi:hypothetical protein